MEYSFLTSVYKNTDCGQLSVSIEAMLSQTVPPAQIVVVFDGPVTVEVKNYLEHISRSAKIFTFVPLEKNVGLGLALRAGTDYCQYDYIARMDTDDVCSPERMEKQLAALYADPNLSVIGSNMGEFIGSLDNIVGYRNVPETHEQICEYLKSRCPMNHITATLRKSSLLAAGGYMDWSYEEDYFLWIRMYLAGCKFYNIQEVLAFARVGEDMYKRRGGWRYYKSERDLFKYMYKNKIIGYAAYLKAKAIRFTVQVLMPNFVRQWFFNTFARDKNVSGEQI